MGIQSTKFITREEAERMVKERRERKLDVSQLTDEELESELDETFYNYSITNSQPE
jgi:hypothetical protein